VYGINKWQGNQFWVVARDPFWVDVRITRVLSYLQVGEAHKIHDTDLDQYRVVRVSGEITVDLLRKACDVTYRDASTQVLEDEIQRVTIPHLKPELLIKTKMGVRPKDVRDRNFLQRLAIQGKDS
jgi:hypothetical protein